MSESEQGYIESRIIYESADEIECEILQLTVFRQFRNRGHGTKLLAEFLRGLAEPPCGAKKAVTVFLEVREDNTPALKLYKKAGFEEISKRNNYYDDGCTAVCMKYSLGYIS